MYLGLARDFLLISGACRIRITSTSRRFCAKWRRSMSARYYGSYSIGCKTTPRRGARLARLAKSHWPKTVRESLLSDLSRAEQADSHTEGVQTLRAHLCADEVVVMTIDTRTGRLNLRDTGAFAAAHRGRRFNVLTDRLNDNPMILYEAYSRLKMGVSVRTI